MSKRKNIQYTQVPPQEIEVFCKGVLAGCRAFYSVYCQLELENAVPSIEDAEGLNAYFDKIEQDGYVNTTIPEIVNGAFAVELALKFFICKYTVQIYKTHNLEILYNKLPDEPKKIISETIYEKAYQNEETLNLNLCQFANCFDDWRYFFEKRSVGCNNIFKSFVHIVCDYALSFIDK